MEKDNNIWDILGVIIYILLVFLAIYFLAKYGSSSIFDDGWCPDYP